MKPSLPVRDAAFALCAEFYEAAVSAFRYGTSVCDDGIAVSRKVDN